MIDLQRYNWTRLNNTWFTGTAWLNNTPLTIKIINKILTDADFNTFTDFTSKITGQYTLLIKVNKQYYIATDPVGRFPLFYTKDKLLVTDNPELLTHSITKEQNNTARNYFLHFGTCPNNSTLINAIFQTEPGSTLMLSENTLNSHSHILQFFNNNNFDYTEKGLSELLNTIFERYLKNRKNEHFVIPLTAGYDSRLIATMLKQYGCKNVLCVTWGRKNNLEYQTAKKIASTLGFDYLFIEYTNELIENFSKQQETFDYINYTAHFSSMPYLQDYFAIKHLKETHQIPDQSTFIPGQSGDMYAGSHLIKGINNFSRKQVISYIINRFNFTELNNARIKDIANTLDLSLPSNLQGSQLFDYWDLTVRQAKFVVNSVSAFNYFGFKTILPLSDLQLINYFFSSPFLLRLGEKLYRSTLVNYYFKPYKVDYDLKKNVTPEPEPQLKTIIKKKLPYSVKKLYYSGLDPIFYNEITTQLMNELDRKNIINPIYPGSYNSYIIQWYLNTLKN